MNVMVIGSGGREHAIVHALAKSTDIDTLYCLPGNGGIASEAECVNIKATDIQGIVEFAEKNSIDFAAVIPDDPLAMGLTDVLRAKGVPCFGPSAAAARIESSKAYAKDLMRRYGIPTASYEVFSDRDKAVDHVKNSSLPIVVKADGLALGKGVIIAQTQEDAITAIDSMMLDERFGKSGKTVVIEEFLQGPEVSLLVFTDSKTYAVMPSSMDHKRSKNNDEGDNTGGMGTVSPNPFFDYEALCTERIIEPTIKAMIAEGTPFKGCLYFGLMITKDGPKVIEYNCRFGDPETQVVLPLLNSDLFEILRAVESETLSEIDISFKQLTSCCVVLCSDGYPGKYDTGFEISFDDGLPNDVLCYHAGTKLTDGKLVTSGGRVLGVVCVRDSLSDAVEGAYKACEHIHFKGKYMRTDIGRRALTMTEGKR